MQTHTRTHQHTPTHTHVRNQGCGVSVWCHVRVCSSLCECMDECIVSLRQVYLSCTAHRLHATHGDWHGNAAHYTSTTGPHLQSLAEEVTEGRLKGREVNRGGDRKRVWQTHAAANGTQGKPTHGVAQRTTHRTTRNVTGKEAELTARTPRRAL